MTRCAVEILIGDTSPPVEVVSIPMLSFNALAERLAAQGFAVKKDMTVGRYRLRLAAVKTKFELSKGRVGRFVLGAEIDALDPKALQDYSSACFEFASNNFSTKYLDGMVVCVPILLYDRANEELQRWVSENLAPRHYGGVEFPVVACKEDGLAYYCRKTPVWGAAFYGGYRKFVEELLAAGFVRS